METSESEVERATWPSIVAIRILGFLPIRDASKAYKCYSILVFTLFLLMPSLLMQFRVFILNEIEKIAEDMYIATCYFSFMIKIWIFQMRWDSMQRLVQIAKNFRLESDEELDLLKAKTRITIRIIVALFISVNVAHFSAESKVFLSHEVLFPFPVWYPEDWFHGVKYSIALTQQFIAGVYSSNTNAAFEGFTATLLIIVNVQLDILGLRLKSIGYGENEMPASGNLNRSIRMRAEQAQLKRLITCIRLHMEISALSISHFTILFNFLVKRISCTFRFTQEIERIFSIAILGQISTYGLIICSLVHQMAKVFPIHRRK